MRGLEVDRSVEYEKVETSTNEWKPFFAEELGLGSLPPIDAICVCSFAVLPSLAVVAMNLQRRSIVAEDAAEPRQLSQVDQARCASNTTASIFVVLAIFALTLFIFFKSLMSNPNLERIIKKNARIERDKFKMGSIKNVMVGAAYAASQEAATETATQAAKDIFKDGAVTVERLKCINDFFSCI